MRYNYTMYSKSERIGCLFTVRKT